MLIYLMLIYFVFFLLFKGPAKVAVHEPKKFLKKHEKEPKLPDSKFHKIKSVFLEKFFQAFNLMIFSTIQVEKKHEKNVRFFVSLVFFSIKLLPGDLRQNINLPNIWMVPNKNTNKKYDVYFIVT